MLDFEKWESAELPFAANDYNGRGDYPSSRIVSRSQRVCITALHAVNHYRDGQFKKADRRTGGLVELLGHSHEVSTAINCRRSPEIEPREGQLTTIEKYLVRTRHDYILDIHSAKPSNNFDFCIGTGPEKITPAQHKIIKVLQDLSAHYGLHCALNQPDYSAQIPAALTHRLKQRGYGHVIQIEINAHLLHSWESVQQASNMLQILHLLCTRLQSYTD